MKSFAEHVLIITTVLNYLLICILLSNLIGCSTSQLTNEEWSRLECWRSSPRFYTLECYKVRQRN